MASELTEAFRRGEAVFFTRTGWHGVFTTHQATGYFPNGTRVVKCRSERGDTHALGALGTVLGSVSHPEVGGAYFVEWDGMPCVAVGVAAWKLERV